MLTHTGLAFEVTEYQSRVEAARRRMRESGVDLLIVTTPENITYLTGYHTTGYHVFQCLLLPAEGDPSFVVRGIELDNARQHSWISAGVGIAEGASAIATLVEVIRGGTPPGARVGYESLSLFLPPAFVDQLRAELPDRTWVATTAVVEAGRMVKSPAELALIRRAAGLTEIAVHAAADACRPGVTDSEVTGVILATLAAQGSEYTGSPPFAVAGPDSATAHATHARRPIRQSDNIWLELGASLHRYHAAIGRVVTVGTPPPDVERVFDVAARALTAMVQAMGPGATSGDVDRAGRAVAEEAGLVQHWRARGGYSMGVSFPPGLGEGHIIDIHAGDPRPLAAGMVFHLIPIISVPGVGAIGCTETVAVTEGGAETFATLPRELIRR